jgi:membrane protease YdiL (CAAX protease family)
MALLAMPPVLIATTYVAFTELSAALGPRFGYLAGFLFYWTVWCGVFPLWLLGPQQLRDLFRDVRPRLGRPACVGSVALLLPPAVGFGLAFPAAIASATGVVVLLSAVLAGGNAIAEEVLWRGCYARIFPGQRLLGYIYPTLGFALWHVSPQVIFPNSRPGGAVSFVVAAGIWGLCYGWVAWRTRSIRWTTVSHALLDFSGLGARIYLR